ncbi:MAG: hypothetical protein NT102_05140 [Caldiserica bacterium]|nr:hypothetical protein [Caldisericota bacterium]
MEQSDLLHFIPMLLGIVALLAAAFIGKTDKGGKKLSIHKAVAGIGVAIVLLGVAWLVVTGALEPDLMHFYSALLASVFVTLTPVGGLLYLKAVPTKKAGLRKSHRIDAAIVFGLAALTVILGILDK